MSLGPFPIVLIPSTKNGALQFYNDLTGEILEASFSRPDVGATSGATVFDKEGNLVELAEDAPDWSFPVGGGCPRLLMRPQAENLFNNPTDFDQSSWTKSNIAKQGEYTSPIILGIVGKQYGPNLVDVFPAMNCGGIGSSVNGEVAHYYIVRYAGWKWVELLNGQDGDSSRVWYDLENGVKGNDADNVGSIQALGDQTYKISYTTAGRANGDNATIFFSFRGDNGSTAKVDADGTGVIFFAAQYTAGTSITSLIPFKGTRSANQFTFDDVLLPEIINSSNGAMVGSIYFEVENYQNGSTSGTQHLALTEILSDRSKAFTWAENSNDNLRFRFEKSTGVVFDQITLIPINNSKVIFLFDENGVEIVVNGSSIVTSSEVIPDTYKIFEVLPRSGSFNFKDNRLAYTPIKISSAEAISLTS